MNNEPILNQLEFFKILSIISSYAVTENGKEVSLAIRPLANINIAIEEGKKVDEAKEFIIQNDLPPLEYLPNLQEELGRSRIEGTVLREKHILSILHLAEISRKMYSYLSNTDLDNLLLSNYKEQLFIDKNFEKRIRQTFTESGDISDNASADLKSIRREIISKGDQLRKVVAKIQKKLSNSYLVQDEYTTQRDGRIVLPIKAEHKRHVRGFIHSESATGQTVYIEPEETLELNNEILSLHFAERREIERILKEITKSIGDASEQLKISLRAISELDSIFAKARYSVEIIGSFPDFNDSKSLNVIDARHPILIKKLTRAKTVPLNVKLENKQIILITGPNAGGKTVVLKTLGLLILLAQSGIHIPCSPDSNFHWFNHVLIDIGDKQSIEDDLSTFSSHLSNIKNILELDDSKTLVLLDELGTGTDPAEGSALAMATLLNLRDKGSKVFATTHHGNMKIYANDLEAFENSSMEFDTENLVPTYKFHQGVPGSSYALEVAERIGFDESTIELSKNYMDASKSKVEELLLDLENKSNKLQLKLNKLELENSRLKGLSNLYEKRVASLEKQKNEIIEKTKEEADKYLIGINKKVEQTIKNIRETQADKKVIKKEKEKLSKIKLEHSNKFKTKEKPVQISNKKLKVGDFASVANTSTSGEIVEIDETKKMATLAVGSIRLQVKLQKLLYTSKIKKVEKRSDYQYFTPTAQNYTLDIRGQKPEEAEFEVVKFIDDSYAANNQRVEIIHGKGTGVLKKMVHEILKFNECVNKFYFAKIEHGGDGITIVELK